MFIPFKLFNTDGLWLYDNSISEDAIKAQTGVVANDERWMRLTRSGTTCTMNTYTDSGFSVHDTNSPGSATCSSTAMRYLYAGASGPQSITNQAHTGYTENIDIVSAGGGEPETLAGVIYVQ